MRRTRVGVLLLPFSCYRKLLTQLARAQNKSYTAKIVPAEGGKYIFVLSQEIASCERKSLRQDAQLAEKKHVADATCSRAEQKLYCQNSARRGRKVHFCSIILGL